MSGPTFIRADLDNEPQRPAGMQDGEDITIPVGYKEVTSMMPSHGIPYPKGTRWFVRPHYFEEVLAISEVLDGNVRPEFYYDHIIKGVAVMGTEVDMITMSDFFFLTLYRKAITLGADKFQLRSQENPEAVFNISIEQLDFKDFEPTALPIRVKLRGEEYHFEPVRYRAYMEFLREHGDAPSSIDIMALSCIQGNRETIYRAYGNEVNALRKIDSLLDHGLQPIKYVDEGGREIKIEVDDPNNILLPFRSPSDLEEFEISFG